MTTNKEFEIRRDNAVARAIAYSSTFVAERAENAEIWDVEGKRYIDFCGGIGCQNTGHRNAHVVSAIKHQLDSLTHTCFQVTPYESYITLAERLNALLPGDFAKKSLFFSAGGEAVENAIKIARYYTKRPALITFTNGYHGRSYMGMALSARMVPFSRDLAHFPLISIASRFQMNSTVLVWTTQNAPLKRCSEVIARQTRLLRSFLNQCKARGGII